MKRVLLLIAALLYASPLWAAPPAFQEAGAGAASASSGNLSVAYPVTGLAANDIFFVQVCAANTTGDVTIRPDTPASWTLIGLDTGDAAGDGTGEVRTVQMVAALVSPSGAESGSLSVAFTNDAATQKVGRIYRYRGSAITSFTEASNFLRSGSGGSATITDVGMTTLGVDRLAMNFICDGDNEASTAFTGQTGGTWVEAVAEFTDGTGTDAMIVLQTADMAAAGTINGGSFANASADVWVNRGFALLPFPSRRPIPPIIFQ